MGGIEKYLILSECEHVVVSPTVYPLGGGEVKTCAEEGGLVGMLTDMLLIGC